jgi:hypothetical protein
VRRYNFAAMNGKKLTPAEQERLGAVEEQLRALSDAELEALRDSAEYGDFRRELERALTARFPQEGTDDQQHA